MSSGTGFISSKNDAQSQTGLGGGRLSEGVEPRQTAIDSSTMRQMMGEAAYPSPSQSSFASPSDSPRSGSPTLDASLAFHSLVLLLTSPELANRDPRLLTIGMEMESLEAIYGEGKCRLHSSGVGGGFGFGLGMGAFGGLEEFEQLNAGKTEVEDNKGSSDNALRHRLIDDLIALSLSERLAYEIVLPLFPDSISESEIAAASTSTDNDPLTRSEATVRLLVSLAPTYPESSAPQIQLLGRYLGRFRIDDALFGLVTRAYLPEAGEEQEGDGGCTFTPGDVCVFDGVEWVLDQARKWYKERMKEGKEGEESREREREERRRQVGSSKTIMGRPFGDLGFFGTDGLGVDDDQQVGDATEVYFPEDHHDDRHPSAAEAEAVAEALSLNSDMSAVDRQGDPRDHQDDFPPEFDRSYSAEDSNGNRLANRLPRTPGTIDAIERSLEIFSSDPIVQNKSVFVGHACRVTDPLHVPLVVHRLLGDKKIAKAAHPVIHAYRIVKEPKEQGRNKIVISDNDDDGETAAGGRLQHLLQILELENVIVVVTRWYGGTHLGPLRFQLINQAARAALEKGGFLEESANAKKGAVSKKGRS